MKRVLAFIIDAVIGFSIFAFLLANAYDQVTGSVPESGFSNLGLRDYVGLIFMVTFILSLCYLSEKLFGSTIGQNVLGIKKFSR